MILLGAWHRSRVRGAGPWSVRSATATEGGTCEVFGREFADRLTRFHGDAITSARAVPTHGLIDNLRRLNLDPDDPEAADLGLAMHAAIEQTAEALRTGRIVAAFFENMIELLVPRTVSLARQAEARRS